MGQDNKNNNSTSTRGRKRKLDDFDHDNSELEALHNKQNPKLESTVKDSNQKQFYICSFLDVNLYKSIECGGGGNCLLYSISYLLPREDINSHESLRNRACDYIEDHVNDYKDALEGLINEDTNLPYTLNQYITDKRKIGTWGDEPEISALAKVLNKTIIVFQSQSVDNKLLGYYIRSRYTQNRLEEPLLLYYIYDRYVPHYPALVKLPDPKSKDINTKSSGLNDEAKKTKSTLDEEKSSTSTVLLPLKRRFDQKYPKSQEDYDRYNDVLQYFQSGKEKKVPERLLNSNYKSTWKAKVETQS